MPLPDLYLVTKAIRNLVESKATDAYGAPVGTTVVSPQETPDISTPVVNIYLFYLLENAHFKNDPPRNGSGPVPIQHVPIGLDAHYVFTVRVPGTDDDLRVAAEHKLLGIVAKLIHDSPIVTQALLTTPILADDDRFQLILRPVSMEESINFWAGDEVHVARPSLFVEASVIQLEPEEPQILPGIVLSVGTFVFAGRGPQLVTSRTRLAFVPPGFGVQRVSSEPARVALFVQGENPWPTGEEPPADAQPLILENNRLTLVGTGFGGGHRFLELHRVGDPVVEPIRIDLEPNPPNNAAWAVDLRADQLSLSFFTSVIDAAGATATFLPGLHTARVVLEQEPRARVSNQIVFAVIPQITDVNTLAGNVYSIVVAGTYLQTVGLEFVLVVGDEIFTKVTTLTAGGQFRVADASTIEFRLAAAPASEDFPVPLNLTINGAQATPAWLEAP